MERTRATSDDRIRWKKMGGGGFLFNGHLIKPGQVFTARESDIPKAFRDLCKPLDAIPVPPPPPPIEVTKTEYSVKPRGKSKSLFDVVDGNGKVINEKGLTKESADKLAQDLLK